MATVSSVLAPLSWLAQEPALRLLDQRALPTATEYLHCTAAEPVMQAIRTLAVRGAPAIGIAAAYGIVLGVRAGSDFDADLQDLCVRFAATRPTAVNLFWAIERMRTSGEHSVGQTRAERIAALQRQADLIAADDAACCAAIGRHGAPLLPEQGGVLTHCNAGALATGGIGTALGVIRTAVAEGKRLHVWVDETRPLLQGARLTAYEMAADGIPATLMCDNMAGHAMKLGHIQAAVVGADRIAANGDSANKIGTYAVAVLCAHHGIPFYVAAPTSTVDLQCPDGDHIVIEQRGAEEVTHPQGVRFAAEGTQVFNPAFDVATAELIAGIITEEGVARPPFVADLAAMVARARTRRDSRG